MVSFNLNYFIFVHTYHIKCFDNNDILGNTNYSYDFTSIIQKDNIFGTQFHPEKSHGKGLKIIKNFVSKNIEMYRQRVIPTFIIKKLRTSKKCKV